MAATKKLNLKPLWDNVVLKPVVVEKEGPGGIIIPETVSKEKPSKFEVIAIGPGKFNDSGKREPMEVKVGDVVYCSRYAGDEFKVEDVEYRVVHQDSILAIEG